MSIISNLIRKKTINTKPRALCFFFDGKFDVELSKFVELIGPKNLSIYPWSENIKGPNIKLIDEQEIPNYTYDFIIGNDIGVNQQYEGHHKYVANYSQHLHIPSIIIQHTKFPATSYHLAKRIQECGAKLYSTEYKKEESIPYGVDSLGKTKNISILIDGTFRPEDTGILNHLKQNIPELQVVGDNPTIEYNIFPQSYSHYRNTLSSTKILINLNTQHNIPYNVLWAMADGAIIISLKTPAITKLIENNNNGILCENVDQIIEKSKELINKTNKKISTNAKKVKEIFDYETFKNRWVNIIEEQTKRIYVHGS